jgi:hypothetical protein
MLARLLRWLLLAHGHIGNHRVWDDLATAR